MRTQMIVLISLAALILFPGRGLTQSRASSPTAASGTPTPSLAVRANAGLEAILVQDQFRRSDSNGDGLLSNDELPEQLRSERERWDTNRNGFIDQEEFRAYYLARMAQLRADSPAVRMDRPSPPRLETRDRVPRSESEDDNRQPVRMDRPATPRLETGARVPRSESEDDNRRPVVYRPGKLPNGLPSWFGQLDTDRDGQLGLYEWKTSGRPLEEFRRMDRNNDGFLTVQEVLRYLASQPVPSGTSTALVNSRDRDSRNGYGPGPTPDRAGTGPRPLRDRKP